MNKKELANLAINLFDNIDQADQFDVYELFYHLDNAFLVHLIGEFYEAIKQNKKRGINMFSISPEDELEEIMARTRKVLGITEDEY